MYYAMQHKITGKFCFINAPDLSQWEDYNQFPAPEFKDQKVDPGDIKVNSAGDGVELITVSAAEALAAAREAKYDAASAAYERYVTGRGYTAAWQRTGQAQRLAVQKIIADDTATSEQKAAAQDVEDRFAALEEYLVVDLGLYFAQVGAAIFAAETMEELEAVSWDFSQFDAQDPQVSMHVDVYPSLAVAKGRV